MIKKIDDNALRLMLENFLVAAAYLLLGILSQPQKHGMILPSLLWPGSGLALAVVLIRGPTRLPGLALGNFLLALHFRDAMVFAVTASIAVPLQAWAGAVWLRRFARFRNDLHRVRDVAAFILFGAVLSPVIGATLGITAASVANGVWETFPKNWATWWIGDLMGILIVAPVLITFFDAERVRYFRRNPRSSLLFLAGVASVSWIAFSSSGNFGHGSYATAYLVYPLAIWAALKYGARGASLVTLIVAAIAVVEIIGGNSTFISGENPFVSVVYLWIFLAVLASSSLTLAAVAAEREKARNDAVSTRRQLLTFIEHTPAAVAMFDRNMRYLSVSRRWLRDYRLRDADLIGKSHYEVFTDLSPEWYEDHRRVLNGETYRQEQDIFRRKDGTIDWLRYELHPWTDGEGGIGGIIMITEVITERKKAADALRSSEARYRNLISQLPGAIYRSSPDAARAMESCSPYIEELTGYQAHELGAQYEGFERIIHPDDRAAAWLAIEEQLSRGSHYIVEYRIVRKDGAERHILDKGNRTFRPGDIPLSLDGILFDMTDRKLREAEHNRAVKLESIGALAGGIAHDFNNILTEIHGNIEVARLNASGLGVSAVLDRAGGACNRATELAKQLLTFSKGGDPVKRIADQAELIALIRRVADFSLHGSNSSYRLLAPEDLWKLNIDEEQVSGVVRNLVLNAVQAMPSGGLITLRLENVPADRIRNADLRPAPHLCLSVEDGGTGIDRAHLSHIFDPYFTTKPNRTGLGLSTSLSIARRHGGTIAVQSERGSGSSFRVFLPAVTEDDAVAVPAPAPAEPSGKGRVLVMDDEEGIRRLLQVLLGKIGYEVVLTAHGDDALARFNEAREQGRSFRFVMLDLTVPGAMGGKVAIERLREIDPALRAMVVSGYSDDPIMANCREYGFTTALAKPFSFQSLRAAIGALEVAEV